MKSAQTIFFVKMARIWLALIPLALVFITGCAPSREMVVLFPDDHGRVGKIEVATKGGSRELSQARQATNLSNSDKAPSKPKELKEEEVQTRFGQALAAQPKRPIHFILYFKTGTAELTPESLLLLPEILEEVKKRDSRDVSVVGHTDTKGKDEYNYRLSLKRAQAVAKLLVDQGLDPANIEITSHGEKNLLIITTDDVSEPKNRRVEVTVR